MGRNQESAAVRCATMTGVQKEQCLRDERRRMDADRTAQGRELRGSCDTLIGPEKERCLQQGGTVEAGARSSSGASGAATGK